jgi:hypothetical protein
MLVRKNVGTTTSFPEHTTTMMTDVPTGIPLDTVEEMQEKLKALELRLCDNLEKGKKCLNVIQEAIKMEPTVKALLDREEEEKFKLQIQEIELETSNYVKVLSQPASEALYAMTHYEKGLQPPTIFTMHVCLKTLNHLIKEFGEEVALGHMKLSNSVDETPYHCRHLAEQIFFIDHSYQYIAVKTDAFGKGSYFLKKGVNDSDLLTLWPKEIWATLCAHRFSTTFEEMMKNSIETLMDLYGSPFSMIESAAACKIQHAWRAYVNWQNSLDWQCSLGAHVNWQDSYFDDCSYSVR